MGIGADRISRLDVALPPRLLSILYLVAGVISLFVYLIPGSEGNAVVLSVVVIIWQGILLWKAAPDETQAPGLSASQPHQA